MGNTFITSLENLTFLQTLLCSGTWLSRYPYHFVHSCVSLPLLTTSPRAPSSSSSAPRRSRHFPESHVLSTHCEHWREVGQRCPSELNPQIPHTRCWEQLLLSHSADLFNSAWRTKGSETLHHLLQGAIPSSIPPPYSRRWLGRRWRLRPGPGATVLWTLRPASRPLATGLHNFSRQTRGRQRNAI